MMYPGEDGEEEEEEGGGRSVKFGFLLLSDGGCGDNHNTTWTA